MKNMEDFKSGGMLNPVLGGKRKPAQRINLDSINISKTNLNAMQGVQNVLKRGGQKLKPINTTKQSSLKVSPYKEQKRISFSNP